LFPAWIPPLSASPPTGRFVRTVFSRVTEARGLKKTKQTKPKEPQNKKKGVIPAVGCGCLVCCLFGFLVAPSRGRRSPLFRGFFFTRLFVAFFFFLFSFSFRVFGFGGVFGASPQGAVLGPNTPAEICELLSFLRCSDQDSGPFLGVPMTSQFPPFSLLIETF